MLKMTIKTFFIGLIILFNCQQLLASAVGNGNMLPATGKYYEKAISSMENSYKEGNYVISPLAIVTLDYIFYAVANKQTRREYEKFYFYMESSKEVFEALQLASFGVLKQLRALKWSQPAKQIVDVGTSIILSEEFKANPDAKTLLAFIKKNFPSEVFFEDLLKNSEAAREKINKWVVEFTHGKISNILPSVTPGSKLVAASALYLLANWIHPFTFTGKPQTFYALRNGRTKRQQVTFMTMLNLAHNNYNAFEYGPVRAVRIPLRQRGMVMIIYMPEQQKFSSFLEDWSQDNDLLDRILTHSLRKNESSRWELRVTMPKFTIPALSEALNIIPVHQHFGLKSLFDSSVPSLSFSDESGIPAVNTYYHKAMIVVDDLGIEGAAACGGLCVGCGISEPDQYTDITIDHPFLFQIVGYPFEGEGKMVYFTGQVTDAERAQQ